jgi:hypothetical protein
VQAIFPDNRERNDNKNPYKCCLSHFLQAQNKWRNPMPMKRKEEGGRRKEEGGRRKEEGGGRKKEEEANPLYIYN